MVFELDFFSGYYNHRRTRFLFFVVMVFASVLMVACGGKNVHQRSFIAQRMHQAGSDEELNLTPEELCSSQVVGKISLRKKDLNKTWKTDQIGEIRPCGPGLNSQCMKTTGADPKIILDCDIQSREVHQIQLEGKNIGPEVELFWAGLGQNFSPERVKRVHVDQDRTRALFSLVAEKGWTGKVSKIRIDPCAAQGRVLGIHELRLIQYAPEENKINEAMKRVWTVQLGDEVRPAMIGWPGKIQRWQVDAMPGDHLTTAIGVLPGAKTPLKFVVRRAEAPTGTPPIFSKLIQPGSRETGFWKPVDVPLGVSRGQKLKLEFTTSCPSSEPSFSGLPVWASPSLRRVAKEDLKPNIVLISIDTVRADHLSAYSYPRHTSPHIDAWARDGGLLFENAVAAAPWTLPSHVSMLSGVEAIRHGINYGIPDHSFPLISRVFARHGYKTIAFTGGGFLNPSFGFETGFDVYHSWPASKDGGEELATNTRHFIGWLKSHRDTRFFAFFHTYEVHGPFRPRQPYFRSWCSPASQGFEGLVVLNDAGFDRDDGYTILKHYDLHVPGKPPRPLKKDEMQLARDLYDAGIAYADEHVGRILDTLKSTGLAENTVVVITSDHGEALGDRGLAGHAYPYDFNVMVPLIIRIPGLRPPNPRVSRQVRSVDIAPTLLDVSGLEAEVTLDGVSLLPFFRGREADVPKEAWIYAAKTNYGIGLRMDNTTKFIWNNTAWSPAQNREELYELKNDPAEERNLIDAGSNVDDLKELMLDYAQKNETGLRIRCVNPGSHELRGRFEFDRKQELIITKVKGLDLPPGSLGVLSASAVSFRLLPGADFSVYFEDLRAESLRILGTDPTHTALDLSIDLSDPHKRHRVDNTGGKWQELDRNTQPGRLFFEIKWHLPEGRQIAGEGVVNPELQDQLRALGYLQ